MGKRHLVGDGHSPTSSGMVCCGGNGGGGTCGRTI